MTIFRRILGRLGVNLNPGTSLSQKQAVSGWLHAGKTLTGLEALRLFGCIKLSNRISELRADGLEIKDRWITVNANGTEKRVKQYYITNK